MASLPKPLIAVLVATVAVAALWTAVLKKTITGGSSGGSQTTATYQSAIAKAHQAVATSNAASVAHGGTVVQSTTSSKAASEPGKAAAVAPAPSAKSATTSAKHAAVTSKHAAISAKAAAASAKSGPPVGAVLKAISEHRVVALLFFNPSAADDLAVKQELAALPTHRGEVAKFAAPVTQLSSYSAVTSRVPVTESPTLLVIDKQGETTTLVGFADQLEIAQRIADALSAK